MRFGAAIAAVATDLLIVGRTNRRALRAGVARGARFDGARPRAAGPPAGGGLGPGALGPRDVVLYENDLPDHYP